MAQYDFGTIDPNTKSGTALATDLNSYRNAVNSMHSGSSAPSYITAGMMWVDTTSADYKVKLYDGAQSITVAIIDATNNVARVAVDPAETSYITSTTAAQIRHVIANTDIFTTRSTGIQFNIASPVISDSNNNELISFTTTASAINQINVANAATGGAVEISAVGSDTNISVALMPKGTGGLGIGVNPPLEKLHISGNFRVGSAVLATPSGSAPLYAPRAWVNFNGTATLSIRASGNVTSITDNGAGDYTINFTTAMPDADYVAVFGSAAANSSRGGAIVGENSTNQLKSTTQLRILAVALSNGTGADAAPSDQAIINVIILR